MTKSKDTPTKILSFGEDPTRTYLDSLDEDARKRLSEVLEDKKFTERIPLRQGHNHVTPWRAVKIL